MTDNPSPHSSLLKYRQDELERLANNLQTRVEKLERDLIEARLERERLLNAAKESLEEEIVDLELEVGKLSSRLTLFQGAQAVFTTIAGVIASIVGRV